MFFHRLIVVVLSTQISRIVAVSWEDWWTYDGISGPSFWGLINPEWSLCNEGRMQSPINIDPGNLLYDHTLGPILVGPDKASGRVVNTGHGVSLVLNLGINNMVNISGGPVAYNYPIYTISIHFGLRDDVGSEHTIDGQHFAGELQLIGYNADIYENQTVASKHPNGLVAISILIQVGQLSNPELRRITEAAATARFRGNSERLQNFAVANLLPDTSGYMTYDGSQTEPGCGEALTWVIMNRPIYITHQQLHSLRKLNQGDEADPRAPLGGNFRPIQAQNGRTIRTNIFVGQNEDTTKCPTLQNSLEYKASKLKTKQ